MRAGFNLFDPHSTFTTGIINPPAAAYDSRRTAVQSQMNELSGLQGVKQQGLMQYSGQAIPTMTTPAMSVMGVGNPAVEQMPQVLEMKTIFRANETFPGMLGPSGIAPLTFTDNDAWLVETLTFNEALPNVRAPRGRVTFGTAERRARTGTLRSFGSGLEFTYQFLKGRAGPLYLRLAIEQLNNGIVDHLLLMAYELIQQSHDWGIDIWARQINAAGQRPGGITVQEWFQRSNMLLGLMQKETRPLEAVMSYVTEQQKLIQQSSNALVLHHKISNFVKLNIPAYIEYFRAGERGPSQVGMTDDAALQMHINGYDINVVRANSIDDAQEFPFMENEVRYGEFYVMENEIDCENDPDGKDYPCWIEIYNQYADSTWERISLIDAIRASRRFLSDDKLRAKDDGGFMIPMTPVGTDSITLPYTGATPLASDKFADPFMKEDGTRLDHINDLANRGFLPASRLQAMARRYKAMNANFRSDMVKEIEVEAALAPAAKGGAITSLVLGQIGAQLEQQRQRAEQQLVGSWRPASGKWILAGNNTASLVRSNALTVDATTKQLDSDASNDSALQAMAMLQNLSSDNNASAAAHTAIITGLNMVKADDAQAANRVGSYIQSLVSAGVVPRDFAEGKRKITATYADAVKAVQSAMTTAAASGRDTFGDYTARDFTAAVRPLQSQIIGSQVDSIGAQYTGSARRTYLQSDNVLDLIDPNLLTEAKLILDTEFTLKKIEHMIALRIPLPFKVVLLRPNIRLITYGMIACQKGAQRIYYGMPTFSWNDDGHAQVVRAVVSYKAGGFIHADKTLFHLPDVLISRIQSGMGKSFHKGRDGAGDIIALLEPINSPMTRSTELITAYGSFNDVELLRGVPLAEEERGLLFWNRAWIRAMFGINPAVQNANGESAAAYAPEARPEHMICWRGGSRHLNGLSGNIEFRRPAGPFADMDGYGPNMNKAFTLGRSLKAPQSSRLELLGH